jgi:biopolymer transport protein ExbD
VDKSIQLPLAVHGNKRDDKAAAGLINISWNEATKTPTFKLDDKLILDADTNSAYLDGTKEPIVEMLKKRKGNNEQFRLLIRADKKVQAKFLERALRWGAEAEVANIAFSGVNNEN